MTFRVKGEERKEGLSFAAAQKMFPLTTPKIDLFLYVFGVLHLLQYDIYHRKDLYCLSHGTTSTSPRNHNTFGLNLKDKR